MGRQRKRVVNSEAAPLPRKDEKPSAFHRKEKKKKVDIGKVFINISIGLCIFSLIWFFYALYMRSSLAKRVVTLHPSPSVLDANSSSAKVSPERFWGSYRPQVYFGMKTRSPRSIVTGMMWMRQFSDMDVNLRHTCEQGDRLQGYGWLMHDGITFGVQEIRDNDFTLTTEFVKRMGGNHGGDWTWRITAKQHSSAPQAPVISLMFYAAADTQGSLEAHVEERNRLASITGFSEELGNFKITFRKPVTGELSSAKYARQLGNSRYSSWIRPKNWTVRVLRAWIQQRRGQEPKSTGGWGPKWASAKVFLERTGNLPHQQQQQHRGLVPGFPNPLPLSEEEQERDVPSREEPRFRCFYFSYLCYFSFNCPVFE